MVFIRPTILRDSIDARFMSTSKYNYLQNLQREQANERPVQLMRDQVAPTLPDISPPDGTPIITEAPIGEDSGE
jgi:hypothetical protein